MPASTKRRLNPWRLVPAWFMRRRRQGYRSASRRSRAPRFATGYGPPRAGGSRPATSRNRQNQRLRLRIPLTNGQDFIAAGAAPLSRRQHLRRRRPPVRNPEAAMTARHYIAMKTRGRPVRVRHLQLRRQPPTRPQQQHPPNHRQRRVPPRIPTGHCFAAASPNRDRSQQFLLLRPSPPGRQGRSLPTPVSLLHREHRCW